MGPGRLRAHRSGLRCAKLGATLLDLAGKGQGAFDDNPELKVAALIQIIAETYPIFFTGDAIKDIDLNGDDEDVKTRVCDFVDSQFIAPLSVGEYDYEGLFGWYETESPEFKDTILVSLAMLCDHSQHGRFIPSLVTRELRLRRKRSRRWSSLATTSTSTTSAPPTKTRHDDRHDDRSGSDVPQPGRRHHLFHQRASPGRHGAREGARRELRRFTMAFADGTVMGAGDAWVGNKGQHQVRASDNLRQRRHF